MEGEVSNPIYADVLTMGEHHQHIRDALTALPPSELSTSFDETQLQRMTLMFGRSDSRVATDLCECPSTEMMTAEHINAGQQSFIRRAYQSQHALVLAQNIIFNTVGQMIEPQLEYADRPFRAETLDPERILSSLVMAGQLVGHSSLQFQWALKLHNLYSAAPPADVERTLGIPAPRPQ